MVDRAQSVASVVLEHSECAELFQRRRIDYCCRGDMSVEAAAKERGLDVDALLAEIERAIAERRGEGGPDPRALSTAELIEHIVSGHHAYLRRALPVVLTLARKVARVHGDHNPKLRELDAATDELAEVLLPHLDDEERALFPALASSAPDRAAATKMLDEMAVEHLAVGKLLERVRAASDDFTFPDWACNSYRTLFSELRQLEGDVLAHVHLENHVLKPRFAPPPAA